MTTPAPTGPDSDGTPTESTPATTLLVTDPACLNHVCGPGHPESPMRLRRIIDDLEARPIAGTAWMKPRAATIAELTAVHAPAHVSRLVALDGRLAALDPDTGVSPGSWRATATAAGAGVVAVEEVMAGRARNAFALVRPPATTPSGCTPWASA